MFSPLIYKRLDCARFADNLKLTELPALNYVVG